MYTRCCGPLLEAAGFDLLWDRGVGVQWALMELPAVQRLSKPDGGYGTRAYATLWESYCALRVVSRLRASSGGSR